MASKIIVNLDTSIEFFLNSKCKQNDDLILECSIFENGLAKDLSNCSIVIQALKADKTYIIQNTDITKENNKFTANLVRDFTRVPGKTEIEIVLTESSKQNTTFSFSLEVIGSVIKGAVESGNTPTILEVLQKKIVEAGAVKEETEQLIEKGGAATKGEIQEVNASLVELTNQALPLLENPQVLAKMFESNYQQLLPYWLELIEEGQKDGSIKTEQPKELAELLILTDLWMIPSLFPGNVNDIKNRYKFVTIMLGKMGLPLYDEEMLAKIDNLPYYEKDE